MYVIVVLTTWCTRGRHRSCRSECLGPVFRSHWQSSFAGSQMFCKGMLVLLGVARVLLRQSCNTIVATALEQLLHWRAAVPKLC